jgi:hypothetical protein
VRAQLFGQATGRTAESNGRFPRRVVLHRDIGPFEPDAPAGAQGFEDRFLRGKAGRKVREGIRLPFAVVQLARHEGAGQEGGVALGEVANPPDLHHVHTDADDHGWYFMACGTLPRTLRWDADRVRADGNRLVRAKQKEANAGHRAEEQGVCHVPFVIRSHAHVAVRWRGPFGVAPLATEALQGLLRGSAEGVRWLGGERPSGYTREALRIRASPNGHPSR